MNPTTFGQWVFTVAALLWSALILWIAYRVLREVAGNLWRKRGNR